MRQKLFIDKDGNYSLITEGDNIRMTVYGGEEVPVDEKTATEARKMMDDNKKFVFDKEKRKLVAKKN